MSPHEYHVAPGGHDDGPGTPERPFATLGHARDAIRQARAGLAEGTARPGATVVIHGGTYRLDETLVLGREDGGTREAPVVWRAAEGETVVLTGGVLVRGWERAGEGLLTAPVPARCAWHGVPRQLFHKGLRLERARWPKPDPANPRTTGWILPEGPVAGLEYQALVYPVGSLPVGLTRVRDIEAVIYGGWGWCNNVIPVLEIDPDRRVLRLEHEPLNIDQQPWYLGVRFSRHNRFYLANVLEALTEPGEWCWRSDVGRFYLRPPPGFDPECVTAPGLDCLVRLRETQWITIRGLHFTGTTTGDDGHRQTVQQGLGAMFSQKGWRYCGEAVHLRGTVGCVVEDCVLDRVGGNGIYLELDNERAVLRRNTVRETGFNGIVLAGDRVRHPRFCDVSDNDISRPGTIVNFVAGVFLGLSDDIRVHHNRMTDLPHHAVNLASNGTGRNYVEHNEIRGACREIMDTAAINSWGDSPSPWVAPDAERSGHVIRWNLIADTGGSRVDEEGRVVSDSEDSRGIYLDDYTSNCLVMGNIIVRSGTGVYIHGGKHNVVENNIIADCRIQLLVGDWVLDRVGHQPMWPTFVGNHFARNLCWFRGEDALILADHTAPGRPYETTAIGYMDENLYWHAEGGGYRYIHLVGVPPGRDGGKGTRDYEERRALGFDKASQFRDPLFVDPEKDDFRLRPDSPALELGFVPIDASRIGIRRR